MTAIDKIDSPKYPEMDQFYRGGSGVPCRVDQTLQDCVEEDPGRIQIRIRLAIRGWKGIEL